MTEPRAVTYRNRWRFRLEQWQRGLVPWLLEDKADQGLGGPPNNWRSTGPILTDKGEKFGGRHEVYARFGNDGFDVMIGEKWVDGDHTDEQWSLSLSTAAFRQIALWYLWRWAWGDWFGLRRRLYYWNLSRKMHAYRAARGKG